jgi:hypothetical protein
MYCIISRPKIAPGSRGSNKPRRFSTARPSPPGNPQANQDMRWAKPLPDTSSQMRAKVADGPRNQHGMPFVYQRSSRIERRGWVRGWEKMLISWSIRIFHRCTLYWARRGRNQGPQKNARFSVDPLFHRSIRFSTAVRST